MGTDEALSGHALVRCPGCGALVPDVPGLPHPYIGASAGCWEIFGQILAKEYGDYGYPITTHQLTVDAYAVQHPGQPERRSIQSVNSHLISLYHPRAELVDSGCDRITPAAEHDHGSVCLARSA